MCNTGMAFLAHGPPSPQVTKTTATFTGQEGHTYYFRSRAQDNAGNWEAYPGDGDASTTVKDLTPPASAVTGISDYSSLGASSHSISGILVRE